MVIGSYLYDAHGLRAQKVTSTETRKFVYDPSARLLGDYVQTAGEEREYVWMDGSLVATLDTSDQSADIHYVGTDFLGTPRSVVDTQGQTVWSWDYSQEAFGDSTPTGAYSLALRFPGQYHDTESGLNYNVHRDYSSLLGRYVESDPAGLRGGISTFSYVDNRPLLEVDRVGLAGCSGRWIQVGSIMFPTIPFLNNISTLIGNYVCECVWLCARCHGSYDWSGDPHDLSLPRTRGTPSGQGGDFSMSREGGTTTLETSPNQCNCKHTPSN